MSPYLVDFINNDLMTHADAFPNKIPKGLAVAVDTGTGSFASVPFGKLGDDEMERAYPMDYRVNKMVQSAFEGAKTYGELYEKLAANLYEVTNEFYGK